MNQELGDTIRARSDATATVNEPTVDLSFKILNTISPANLINIPKQVTALNGTTNVTVSSSPTANNPKQVIHCVITNRDTVAHTVVLERFDGSTATPLHSVYLLAGEKSEYSSESLWHRYTAKGAWYAAINEQPANSVLSQYILPLQRASLAGSVLSHEMSHWRTTGFPAQGTIPTAAAICSGSLVGAFPLASRSGNQKRLLLGVGVMVAAANHVVLFEDRLGHMAGLNGTLTTAQSVGLNLHTSLATSNLAQRIGKSDYSEIDWYLEWYLATGATISTPTAQVTFHDGTTGSVNIWVAGASALPASVAASRRYRISPTNGKFIRSVESVTLSASTATAGNFGVTAVRRLYAQDNPFASVLQYREIIKPPEIFDNACLTTGQIAITTATGVISGTIVQAII